MFGSSLFPREDVPLLCRRYRHGDHYAHDHDFIEIATITTGRGEHLSMYGDQSLSRGDIFVLRPGAWHGYRSPSSFLVYNLCIGTELFQRELAWVRDDPQLGYLLWTGPIASDGPRVMQLRLAEKSLQRCEDLLDRLRDAVFNPRHVSRPGCVGLLLVYLDELAKHLGPVHQPQADTRPTPHRLVTEGTHLLESNISHPWTLSELADRLQADESYIARVFKAGTGLPPMAYLTRARVERAAVLLLSTNHSISDIGHQVGWDDPNYFARRFRAHLGLTATEYRRRHITLRPRA
jgi:AraC family L-rhamnose operon transcriptional activator RhaR